MKISAHRFQALAAFCLIAASSLVLGQSTSIKLFGPVNVRLSSSGTSHQSPNTVNSTTVNLSCPADSAIQASISSTSDGTGKLLVDNFVTLTVTQGTNTGPKKNICRGGVEEEAWEQQDCFTRSYQSAASAGNLTGQNPDSFVATGGVNPIDISHRLLPGVEQAKIELIDTGGYLASSSLYLQTNCTFLGVSGPGEITGNPISQNNPDPQQLAQSFPFNPVTDQVVQFTYDLSEAQSAGQLTIADGTIPGTADLPLTPAQYTSYVAGTSFASSNCLIHSGELLNGQPVCKVYTLACQVGTGAAESGALCPISQLPNEIFGESFDGPPFTLPDIAPSSPGGPTFHQGVGFLMASEGWNGPGCTFDPASGLNNLLCPQNLLTSFTGPGLYSDTGRGTHPNSSFITVAPVPEDLTTVSVIGAQPGNWINTSTATFNLSSQPPSLPAVPSFIAAPIRTITYGISTPGAVPVPGAVIPTDTVLTNPVACPTPTNPLPALVFAPQAVQSISGLSDGHYLLHYYAQDCAGTQELQFTQDGSGGWSTSFYTVPINVDTVAPLLASGPTLSPAPGTNGGIPNSYLLNQAVTATYSCSDALSGVVRCGTSTFAPGTMTTPILTSPVDTSTPGSKTFTVTAIDAAGNQTTSSVPYTVVSSSVDLGIVKVAPWSARKSDPIPYDIVVANLGKNAASSVLVKDVLPAGVTFVSATIQSVSCSWSGCSNSTQGTGCSVAGNVVSCTASTLGPQIAGNVTGLYIRIIVKPTSTCGSVITNTATVTSASPDSNPKNNSSSASTYVK
jgi:uncharacterized repeat protein (TIGR01451 family)